MSYTRRNRRRASWDRLRNQRRTPSGSQSLTSRIQAIRAKREEEVYQQSRREISWRWLDADEVLNSLEKIRFV